MSDKKGNWIRAVIMLLLGLIVLAAISLGIVGMLASQRESNDRNASASLKTLASAEADFRSNDRDWNHVNDFWTADVKGLYTLTSVAVPGANPTSTIDPSLKLIELSTAAADGDGTFFPAGGENLPLTAFVTPIAKAGFWYLALLTDQTTPESLEMTYALDTGGKPSMGSVHNPSKFGFSTLPDSSGSGNYAFIINENNTIFRLPRVGTVRSGSDVPPGRKGLGAIYQHWPDDQTYEKTFAPHQKK
jgi:hypothetical protein